MRWTSEDERKTPTTTPRARLRPSTPCAAKARRTTQWSWLHATACSSALVASGAYVHRAVSDYISALHVPPRADAEQKQHDHEPTPTVASMDELTWWLPWPWLAVYIALLAWIAGLLVLRRCGLHLPLRRLGDKILRTQDAAPQRAAAAKRTPSPPSSTASTASTASSASTVSSTASSASRSSSTTSRGFRRLASSDIEIDDDDQLVVTSLSLERRADAGRPRSTTASSRRQDESTATAEAAADENAQILLHPRDGANGGRHHSNQIIVDDQYVSRFHFRIHYDPLEKEFFLEDLGSTTGTFVYLKPDVPKRLNVGDLVKLGDTEFEVLAIDASATTGLPYLRLRFTDGPMRGVSQTIGKSAVTLGRRSTNALCIPDDTSISGRHSVIAYLGDGFYLTDLHSTNGTALRLSPSGVKSARRYLLHGDVFGVGSNRFLVEYLQELRIQRQRVPPP
ncbi:hypothetical protein P43SY_003497 [Pythium insidiosum]|uniref:FHA domain-containing protein n=1 Tax=Pythium insidiosum TaxID=114742 RepID=A0AAD5M7Q5_PYTIN|nr:hypothetical protein P43SY_003497 [Pythium insidiosum]